MAIKKLKLKPAAFLVPEGLASLPSPILLFQKESEMLWCNPAFEKQFGALARHPFHQKNGASLGLIQERPVTLGLLSMPGRHEGFALADLQDKKVPIELRITNYREPEEGLFLIMIDDVSPKVELEKQLINQHFSLQKAYEELKRTQSALVQTAKLASLGKLSSGIAHELNQPLQAIMGFSQELEFLEPLSPTGKEFVNDIIHASRKMAEIIKSLRSFAREAGDEMTDTSVPHAMEEALHLMKHQLIQKGIEVNFNYQEGISLVPANSIQLEQVFINLLSNAKDAIESAHPGKGTITIAIQEQSDSVQVSVKDDGCGMTNEVKQKVFDPFFTTKEVGKGTGLGLSITYGILKKMGAEVKIDSAPGVGTEFKLNFKLKTKTQKGETT